MTCPARLAGHTTFAPLASWSLPKSLGALMRSWPSIFRIWITCIFDHVALFNVVEASFGYLTSLPLSCACTRDYFFNFAHNSHLGYRVSCLKGSYFNFQGLMPLWWWPLTVGLLSINPFEFRPLDGRLRVGLLIQSSCHMWWGSWLGAVIYTLPFSPFSFVQLQTFLSPLPKLLFLFART